MQTDQRGDCNFDVYLKVLYLHLRSAAGNSKMTRALTSLLVPLPTSAHLKDLKQLANHIALCCVLIRCDAAKLGPEEVLSAYSFVAVWVNVD
jgi:hypothetical protein